MSTNRDGKGSILMKLIIAILAVVMIVVILVPGDIWSEEQKNMMNSRLNMISLWEAVYFYKTTHDSITLDKKEIIDALKADSSLVLRKRIVSHTDQLRIALDNYLAIPIVKNLLAISQNIGSTKEDLVNNERFFQKIPEFLQESQDIQMKLTTYESGFDFGDYVSAVKGLDSLYQLRRELADYTLQNAARRTNDLATRVQQKLPNIDFAKISADWNPLNARIAKFMNDVRASELRAVTSVSDRVEDFLGSINDGFNNLKKENINANIQKTGEAVAGFGSIYQKFLEDFLVTEKYAQYKLSETDSLLLNISEANFYTPQGLEYNIETRDTLGVWVEDPTLLPELQEKVLPLVEEIRQMDFIKAYQAYDSNLDSLKHYYLEVKNAYRKNSEVFIKTKELDLEIENIKSSTAFDSYKKLQKFIDKVPNNKSFSEVKELVNDALVSVGSFKQIYGERIFGNLDSIHVKIINELKDFNTIIAEIRKNTYTFDNYISDLDQSMSQIKSVNASAILPPLEKAETGLSDAFLFASDGMERTVYGIFSTKIMNEGKVYGKTGRKSWEE